MNRNNLTYAIISIDDLPKVDFSQVGETSKDTIRRSLDLTKFVLKWSVEPTFIKDESIVPIEKLNHEEICFKCNKKVLKRCFFCTNI